PSTNTAVVPRATRTFGGSTSLRIQLNARPTKNAKPKQTTPMNNSPRRRKPRGHPECDNALTSSAAEPGNSVTGAADPISVAQGAVPAHSDGGRFGPPTRCPTRYRQTHRVGTGALKTSRQFPTTIHQRNPPAIAWESCRCSTTRTPDQLFPWAQGPNR